jgi:hypothetical protein
MPDTIPGSFACHVPAALRSGAAVAAERSCGTGTLLGAIFYSSIGQAIGGENVFAQIATGSALSAVLSTFHGAPGNSIDANSMKNSGLPAAGYNALEQCPIIRFHNQRWRSGFGSRLDGASAALAQWLTTAHRGCGP